MKILGVTCHLLSAPYAAPGDAERVHHLPTGYRPASLIRVQTDGGFDGLGETYAGVYAPEAVAALVRQFADVVVGQDAGSVPIVAERLRLACRYWGRAGLSQSVAGAIEMALRDAQGKALGVPAHRLLGGAAHAAMPVYASGGNNKPDAELRTEMRRHADAGFGLVKIRINHLPSVDAIVRKCGLCREALGPRVGLAADAAQGLAPRPWSAKQALTVARALEGLDLEWLEEPVAVDDYAGSAWLRDRVATRVAGGETVTSLAEAERYLAAGAVDLFQPDASMVGGIDVLQRVARRCEAKGVEVAAHAWSSGVGLMANLHAGFTCANCRWVELPTVENPLLEALLAEPIRLTGGCVELPSQPGLGVRWDPELPERFPFRPGSHYRVLSASEPAS